MKDFPPFTVLYADDEHANRLVFTQSLKHRYRIETVADGPAALERLARDPAVAVLVTDQRMPGMSGTELLRRARELQPATQRIMLTAYEDPKPILEVLNTGLAMHYLLKPWVREELEAALAGAVEQYRLRRDQVEPGKPEERSTMVEGIAAGAFRDLEEPLNVLSASLDSLRRHAELAAELGRLVEKGELPDLQASGSSISRMFKELPQLVEEIRQSAGMIRALNENVESVLGRRDEGRGEDPVADPERAVRVPRKDG